jgi:hypothetical protein
MTLFNINTATVHDGDDGNPYYLLPKGTTIFHGSNNRFFDYNMITFFAFDKKNAETYATNQNGNVKEFTTNKDLKLLALMEFTPETPFYQDANRETQRKFNYRFDVNKRPPEQKYRDSVGPKDRELMEYLCKNDNHTNKTWDGYAMNGNYRCDTFSSCNFHAEMVLCEPRKVLEGFEGYGEEKEDFSSYKRQRNFDSPTNRSPPSTPGNNYYPYPPNTFDSPTNRSPPSTPGNNYYPYPPNTFDSPTNRSPPSTPGNNYYPYPPNTFDSPPRRGSAYGGKKKKTKKSLNKKKKTKKRRKNKRKSVKNRKRTK